MAGYNPNNPTFAANAYYGGEQPNQHIQRATIVNDQYSTNISHAPAQYTDGLYNINVSAPPVQNTQMNRMGGTQPGNNTYTGHKYNNAGKDPVPYQTDPNYTAPNRTLWSRCGNCRDLIWAILFIAHLGVFFGVGFWYYSRYHAFISDSSIGTFTPVNLDAAGWIIVGIAGLCGIVVALILLYMTKNYARQLIWVSLIFSVVSTAVLAIYFLSIKSYTVGIVLILLAALNAFWIYMIQRRIQLTAVMVETLAIVLEEYPQMMLVPLFWGCINYAYTIVATVVLTGFTEGFGQENLSGAARGIAYFFLILSLYWTIQVIANVVYVTISGMVATWYFLAPQSMPGTPLLDAQKRAIWNSFGSICLGSLIVAVIQAFRFFIQQAMRGENQIVQCIVMCLINCLDSMVEYFNKYAYTEIALYGKTYVNAAKDAWQLLKSRGFEAVINDDLTGGLVFFIGLVGSAVTGLIVAGFAYFIINDRNWGAWAGIGALIGGAIVYTAGHIIAAGVTTFFVCYAEDSETLKHTKPAVYERLRQALEVAYGVRSVHNAA